MDLIWVGITLAQDLNDGARETRDRLGAAARTGDWDTVLAIVEVNPGLPNVSELESADFWSPLHHAAAAGAPLEVIERLIAAGASRTLPDKVGNMPITLARHRGHTEVMHVLEPVLLRPAPHLHAVQVHFHEVIRARAAREVDAHQLRLPELGQLTEIAEGAVWFSIPGMYGGFRYWLAEAGDHPRLISESWSRVIAGSGQRHEVGTDGARLVATGFV